ncbi:MAG: hypothetical protein CM1200mP29_06530 [Verrucomicrobiota bacterium]|nr:MAG: hypothetical protein CM1200mP29_06530 [Verrucomicrobiota bacterium]
MLIKPKNDPLGFFGMSVTRMCETRPEPGSSVLTPPTGPSDR